MDDGALHWLLTLVGGYAARKRLVMDLGPTSDGLRECLDNSGGSYHSIFVSASCRNEHQILSART